MNEKRDILEQLKDSDYIHEDSLIEELEEIHESLTKEELQNKISNLLRDNKYYKKIIANFN